MPYYRSPSVSSSFSGGARVDMRADPAIQAWRAARKRASEQLQDKAKAAAVSGQPYKTVSAGKDANGKTLRRFKVSADEVNNLARKYYTQAGYEPKNRQKASARAQRVHGLTTSQLHRPVSRAEAIQLFLEGYRRQATEGHYTNPSGKRKYPTRGAVAARVRPELRGTVIPNRLVKASNPAQALRSRLSRTAGKSPKSVTTPQGRRSYQTVNGREILGACPDEAVDPKTGRVSRKAAQKYNCTDSWKLRRRSAWKNYQVPGVTYFDSPKSAASSLLYKATKPNKDGTGGLPAGSPRPYPSHLVGYPRHRKMQSPGIYEERVRRFLADKPNPMRQGQTLDAYRTRRAGERKAARRNPSASPVQQRRQQPRQQAPVQDFDVNSYDLFAEDV